MPMISPNDMFMCVMGAMLKAIPIPSSVMTKTLSPMTMNSIAFIGMGACPVTGIPIPCTPAILPWVLTSRKLIIKGMPALMHGMSMATCAKGGLIKAIPAGKPSIMILG